MTRYVPFGAGNTSSGAPFGVLGHKIINDTKLRKLQLLEKRRMFTMGVKNGDLTKARIVGDVITVMSMACRLFKSPTILTRTAAQAWAFTSRKPPAEMMTTGLRLLRP